MARKFGAPRPGNLVSRVRQVPLGNQKFQPLPAPTGAPPFHLSLSQVLPQAGMKAIQTAGKLTFHVAGDTGNFAGDTPGQQAVADAMEADYTSVSPPPSFFFHLGDVIYFNGQATGYYPQFYEPYNHYPGPIFACAGNHDGDPLPGDTSLSAFVRNFCAPQRAVSPDSQDSTRLTMTQPNPYWTLVTPYATIIALYSNVPEGGQLDPEGYGPQCTWLENELRTAPTNKALLVGLHHPVYSLDRYHSGSTGMAQTLEKIYANAGRRPDIVLSGHVHDFQRFTEVVNGGQYPHIVAGAGGYRNLHTMQSAPNGGRLPVPFPLVDVKGVTLENYNDSLHGYLRLTVSASQVAGEYVTVTPPAGAGPAQAKTIDSFALDYVHHQLRRSSVVP